MAGRRRAVLGGLAVAGAVAAWEAAAVARAVRREDPGGRHDHATTVGSGLGTPLEVLFLGDSAVDGYGLSVDAALPRQVAARLAERTGRRVRARSVAVSGATSSDVAAFQLPLVRAAGPLDVVVVGVGVNDALRRVPGPAVAEATRQWVTGLAAAAPSAHVVALPCHDLSTAPGLGPVLRRVVGWRCRAVRGRQVAVLEEHGVTTVRLDRPGPPTMYGEDGLHPGVEGVDVLASLVVGALVTRTAIPTT